VNAHSTATPFDTVGVFEPLGVKSLDDFDFDEWTRVLHSNVTAPTAATFAFLDLLKKGAASRPGGLEAGATSSVINIGSTMSQMFMGMGGNVRGHDKSWVVDTCLSFQFV
jgi:NAD(P)-dependent dehydrogenase (short-subunit alcohol dehydrogenase family)